MRFRGFVLLWLATQAVAATAAKEPVYVHLSVLLNDHFNIQATEERLRVTAAMLKRQGARCPSCSVSALLVFSGTSSEAFEERNKATGLADLARQLARSGMADIGYDGIDEPTPAMRPQTNFRRARTPEERWLARLEANEWFLTEYKDIRLGYPDPERPGGLKKTIEVFGTPASVRGVTLELGGDPEVTHLLRRMKVRAVLGGIPEARTYPARNLNGYSGAVAGMGELVSPDTRCAAEVYWQDGYLRLSDTSGEPMTVVPVYQGPEPLKKVLAKLDRSRKHIVQVLLGHPGLYLPGGFEKGPYANPLRYAYDNPKTPVLEPSQLRPPRETEEAFRAEEAVVGWLIDEFMRENPGSRFLSDSALMQLAKTSQESPVPAGKLREAVSNLFDQWQTNGNYPPTFASARGEYFSLADMFQMLVTAIAEYSRTGALPASAPLLPVYGPFEMTDEQGPAATTIPRSALIRACATLAPSLADQAWKPVPTNRIPGWVTVDGHRYNAAQFLRAMAETYLSPSGPDLKMATSQMWSAAATILPSTRRRYEAGSAWTVKPAPFAPK